MKSTSGEVEFTGSGNFQLRSVRINGVDYPLSKENIVTVEIPGVTVSSIYFEGWDNKNTKKVMTADSVYQLYSELSLNTSVGSNPKKVQGVFANEAGQNVTVDYTLNNNGTYVANTTFTTGGTYTMSYVILDDTYVPLGKDEAGNPIEKKLELYLGLRTQIYMGLPMTEEYQQKLAVIDDAIAADIAEYKAANTNATEEELSAGILSITESYKPQKDALYNEYYGAEGMNLKQTGVGYELIYDGSAPMFTEVSCTVTDDKDNPIRALEDVKLIYGSGESNKLDSDMIWNPGSGRYEGRLSFDTPSTYSFNKLEIGKDEPTKNVISIATSAPSIKAISPNPMEYIGPSLSNVSYLEDISPAYAAGTKSRMMSVILKDAASADVIFTVKNSDTDEVLELQGVKTVEADKTTGKVEYAPSYQLNGKTVNGLPTDGNWTIVGMTVANVFYEDVYYDGVPVEEGGTGRLDLSEEVAADNITTEFFTTIKFSSTALPALRYENVPFMGDAFNKELKFTLTDYKGDALENASVTLSYVWQDDASKNFTYSGGSIAESLRVVGGEATSEDGKTFSVGTLNFKLDGTYNVSFEVAFEGKDRTYTCNDITQLTSDVGGFTKPDNVTISWQAPDVKFTAITNESGKNTISADGYSVDTYYTKVKSGCFDDYAPASATTYLDKAGNAASAKLTYKLNSDTIEFAFAGNKKSSASVKLGGQANNARNAGTFECDKIVLVYDGVSYTVTLGHKLKITQST